MEHLVLKSLAAVALASALAACGGGGESDSGMLAEGAWGGETADGTATFLFVLEDGETWGAFGNESTSSFGLYQGRLSTSGTSVGGSLVQVTPFGPQPPANLTVSGTTAPRSSLSLQIGAVTRSLAYDASYQTPANLATMAGTYTGALVGANGVEENAVVTLTSGGVITASSPGRPDCTADGTVSYRNSNKAVVNFTMTFRGTGCLFGNNTLIRGVAQVAAGDVLALGLDDSKTQALLLIADNDDTGV